MFAKLIISISDVNAAWISEVGERFDVYIGCSFFVFERYNGNVFLLYSRAL